MSASLEFHPYRELPSPGPIEEFDDPLNTGEKLNLPQREKQQLLQACERMTELEEEIKNANRTLRPFEMPRGEIDMYTTQYAELVKEFTELEQWLNGEHNLRSKEQLDTFVKRMDRQSEVLAELRDSESARIGRIMYEIALGNPELALEEMRRRKEAREDLSLEQKEADIAACTRVLHAQAELAEVRNTISVLRQKGR